MRRKSLAIARRHPSTVLVPVLLLAVLVGVGVWAVEYCAIKYAADEQANARITADNYALVLKDSLFPLKRPLLAIMDAVQQAPNSWSALVPHLQFTIRDLAVSAPPKTRDSLQLLVVPQGTVQLAYPPALNATLATRPIQIFKLRQLYLDATRAALAAPNLPLVFGPSQVDPNGRSNQQDLTFILIVAIFVPVDGGSGNVTAAATALASAVPSDIPCTPEDCAECFVARDGRRFWGFAASTSTVDITRGTNDGSKGVDLEGSGYRYRLTVPMRDPNVPAAPTAGPSQATEGATGNPPLQWDQPIVVAQSKRPVQHPVTTSIVVDDANTTWLLDMTPETGTWDPAWRVPLIITVVLLSVLLSVLLFFAMVAWRFEAQLLASLLPKSMLKELREGDKDIREFRAFGTANGASLDTPAEVLLSLLSDMAEGVDPDPNKMAIARAAILRRDDLYQPFDLGATLTAKHLEADVAKALMQQLGMRQSSGRPTATGASEHGQGQLGPDDDDPMALMSTDEAWFVDLRAGLGALLGRQQQLLPAGSVHDCDCSSSAAATDATAAVWTAAGASSNNSGATWDSTLSAPQLNFASSPPPLQPSKSLRRLPSLSVAARSGSFLAGLQGTVMDQVRRQSGAATNAMPPPNGMATDGGPTGGPRQGSRLQPPEAGEGAAAGADAGSNPPTSSARRGSAGEEVMGPSASGSSISRMQQALASQVGRTLLLETERILATADEWQFDALALAEASGGQPLASLSFYLLKSTGLMDRLSIPGHALVRYLTDLETVYNAIPNPYHNAIHAADVLQSVHVLLTRGGVRGTYATDPILLLACYMAAMVHDVGHVGRTNDFLIATGHELALNYNDKAPLENHHMATSFRILRRPGRNFLTHMRKEDRTALRRHMIELVLATDMKLHFQTIARFKAVHREVASDSSTSGPKHMRPSKDVPQVAVGSGNTSQRLPTLDLPSGGRDSGGRRGSQEPVEGPAGRATLTLVSSSTPHQPPVLDEADRLLMLQVMIKCADLGHLAASLEVHKRWVAALEEEFFCQGDVEKASGLPVSPLFDRDKPGVTKSQVGFFNVVALPLFQTFAGAVPGARPLVEAVQANLDHWVAWQDDQLLQQAAPAPAAPQGEQQGHGQQQQQQPAVGQQAAEAKPSLPSPAAALPTPPQLKAPVPAAASLDSL